MSGAKRWDATTRRKRHFPYKNCLTVALRRQIPVRIQVIQLCWQWSVQCTLVQRRQAGQHRTDYWELVPQQHSLSVISLKPFLPRCDGENFMKQKTFLLHRNIFQRKKTSLKKLQCFASFILC